MIKFLDLHKINELYKFNFEKTFTSFLATGHYILGSQVSSFESDYAAFCNTKHCIGVANEFYRGGH